LPVFVLAMIFCAARREQSSICLARTSRAWRTMSSLDSGGMDSFSPVLQ